MTPEAQRIAIAEACGWWHGVATNELPVERDGMRLPNTFGPPVEAWWKDDVKGVYGSPPDYLNDLNAMHEAEKTLPPLHESYAIELAKLIGCNEEGELNPWDMWKVSTATAVQRAEAFLRVKGLWK